MGQIRSNFAPPQPDMTLFNQFVKGMTLDPSNSINKGTTILSTGIMNGRPFIQLNQK